MAAIISTTDDTTKEILRVHIDDPDFSFSDAREMAKEKAFEKCDYPMILSWKNSKTGQTNPDYECGVEDRPFWIRYAEGRGANLTIDFNDGEYIFMVLKM